MGRNDRCFCGSGIKTKKCHNDMHPASAVAELLRKYAELDEILRHSLPGNAQAVCSKGCKSCCYDYFYISEIEYYCIQDFIWRNEIEVTGMLALAEKYLDEIKCQYPTEYNKIKRQFQKSRNIFSVHTYFNDNRIKSTSCPCIFLDTTTGACKVYPVRPFICRGYGSVESFGGCNKVIDSRAFLLRDVPLELIMDDVVKFTYKHQSVFLRPYPIAEYVSWIGFDETARAKYAIKEASQRYIEFIVENFD